MAPLLLAIFMRALPLTMFGPLLPGIARSLGATLAEVGWIVATYATGSLIAQPLMGRLSDIRGRRTMLLWCVALFAAGSAVCSTAGTLWVLVAGRIVQALGAGGVQPVVTAMIADRWPRRERGSALGAVYGAFGVGTMVGALAGGAIVDAVARFTANAPPGDALAHDLAMFPWHAVFWLNLILAAATFVAALSIPRDAFAATTDKGRLDVGAIALVAAFACSLMVAATTGGVLAIAAGAAAACCLALLPWCERRAASPLFDPAALEGRGPGLVFATAFVFGIPSFSLTIYSATYFIAQFGATPAQSGLALFALAGAYVAGAIVGGSLVKRVGAIPPLVCGLAISGAALVVLATATPMWAAVAAMTLGGLGLGLASAPPNALLLEYVEPSHAGAASGVAIMLATSGSITAPALVSAFVHYGSDGSAAGLRAAFAVGAALCAACVCIALAMPKPRFRRHADQP